MLTKGIFSPLANSPEFQSLLKGITEKGLHQQLVYGLSASQGNYFMAGLQSNTDRAMVVIAQGAAQSRKIAEDLKALLPEMEVNVFPALEKLPSAVLAHSKEILVQRQIVLEGLLNGQKMIVVTAPEAIMGKIKGPLAYKEGSLNFALGEQLVLEEVLAKLVQQGYERVDLVESGGQFSLRGDILDIYPLTRSNPVRIELFDDEVDSVRSFDHATQRSIEKINKVSIPPAYIGDLQEDGETFLAYLQQKDCFMVVEEPTRFKQQVDFHYKEAPNPEELYPYSEIIKILQHFSTVFFSLLPKQPPQIKPQNIISIGAKGMHPFLGQLKLLADEIKVWRRSGYSILITSSTPVRAEKIQQALREEKLDVFYVERVDQELKPGNIIITEGNLENGFELTQAKLVIVTDGDLFGQRKRSRASRTPKDRTLLAPFIDLKVGDYVVHVNHGIGRYLGVDNLEIAGIKKDYFLIKYAGEDKLYVPTDQVDLIQKYLGSDESPPKLYKLGGTDWSRVKSRVKESVQEMAEDLLVLYAARQTLSGHAFAPDTVWQREFEDAFPFEETPDQLRSIKEIKIDMEASKPMDRLLCGDVGYGKTEVALRAAFKAVMDNKQVAVLVPTTILAQQHYNTFRERFNGFPVTIEMLSRFKSPKEQQQILKAAQKGLIDILIGTHRLVQEDTGFKNLGLLIVDEEQRFGVGHKEKLKQLTKNIDVLTMTATPIPRTLHMSLIGARDMSILETPPENRFPIQTYVVEFNTELIRDAIVREINRGGQVYFVHNRINDIDKVTQQIQSLVPEARVAVGHGQMREDRLEQVMIDFMEGQYDVLVCTTIIETGLDLPNVNTLIVDEADRMGLAQLYQLRGRVGRTNRLAYAYLSYKKDKVLSEVAEKRLQAISEFTAFGSGFKIAMRDLEIRGTGNILGPEQHGHVMAVGFDLYCRLLEEAVQKLKGTEVTVQTEPTIEIPVDAYIADSYIPDSSQKVEIYKKIMTIQNEQDSMEVEEELEDRFGDLPLPVRNLLVVAGIKYLAKSLKIYSVNFANGFIHIKFTAENNLTGKTFSSLYQSYGKKLSFAGTSVPEIKYKVGNIPQEEILRSTEKFLKQIKSVEA